MSGAVGPGSAVKDKVVLVTGGASGLGFGAARMLVDRGARVALLDRPTSQGEQAAAALGAHAVFFSADVTDAAMVKRSVNDAVAHFGRIDVYVGAAGVNASERMLSRRGALHALDSFRRTVEVNLVGAFDVMRHAVAAMSSNEAGADGERGLLINVASIAAYDGSAGQSAYAASKGGLVALTLPLARDLAEWGIRVMTICPGAMDTAMLAGLNDKLRAEVEKLPVFPKRLGRPEDFGALVISLIEQPWLNGEVIRLDAATRLG